MCEKPQQSLQYTIYSARAIAWEYLYLRVKLVAGGEGVGRGNKNFRTQEIKITEEDFHTGI